MAQSLWNHDNTNNNNNCNNIMLMKLLGSRRVDGRGVLEGQSLLYIKSM